MKWFLNKRMHVYYLPGSKMEDREEMEEGEWRRRRRGSGGGEEGGVGGGVL